MGLDDLIWDHMLGEICRRAAKACSRPLGDVPSARLRSAKAWKRAAAFWRRKMVMFSVDTRCFRDKTKKDCASS
jgi:hypothetical protein